MVRRVKVEGSSMLPTFEAGEVLTAIRKWRRVRVGDVVIVRDPRDDSRWLLKRCVARHGSMLDVRGDNVAASTDSRQFGLVTSRDVRYLVLRHQETYSNPESFHRE
ncbi:MAG: S26 family signal peptidase [Actinomycetota bacterium]|nr:S26 family signal peptidase [Actinomycetota bacterium]